ncbi:uncharacterized protein JN550_009177 [Neoarthrinium moseri]|uniref:uncharacterized protein n=1 Tax=Neoarthrinium moseri TaxID=1658444 RepID=UPI001FDB8E9B|nr:uncharacterized protein JN550_009177 [Neoarthrinium moseri]KAI1863898.1 hypothetical protein JN550_009177 [Neoarthrinium moseri]
MTGSNLAKLGRAAHRALQSRSAVAAHHAVRPLSASRALPLPQHAAAAVPKLPRATFFSTSAGLAKPLPPDVLKTAKPAELTDSQYHQLADEYIEGILAKYEEEQDAKGEIDVEYSSGVMTIKYPHGDYVINKQPPNRQIWLSSPLSGPKRYDWVVTSEGQDAKQDTATGGWVYLRDGTFLDDILREETGVSFDGLGA